MQAAAHNEAPAGGLTLGARAALDLDLIEAQRVVELARTSRREYSDLDLQARALADECRCEGKHQQASAYTAQSVRYRCRIIAIDVELCGLLAEVARIEAALSAEATPVTFETGQVEGMDEMMDCGGVAA